MVTPLRAPSDGPIGDSSLSVDDGTASILNQNDSHPLDLEKLLSSRSPTRTSRRSPGAIWWPMVYDLPQEAKQNFAQLKRDAQNKRAMYYIEKVDAEHVFPMAGPMFLREDLFRFNGWGSRTTRSSPISVSSSRTCAPSGPIRRATSSCPARRSTSTAAS
jgi:UDP-MurNAc hydroxylase